MKRTTRGFTLIELLVVIAIIGILASVVLASLNSAREKSRDARRISDVKQLQLALELYFDASSTYPAALADVAPDYIAAVPADPLDAAYDYDQLDSGTNYVLGGTLEDENHQALDNDIDGTVGAIDCADPVYCIQP
jgi:prepilin-type N-terminal cleavage/methylation domain-containing protein